MTALPRLTAATCAPTEIPRPRVPTDAAPTTEPPATADFLPRTTPRLHIAGSISTETTKPNTKTHQDKTEKATTTTKRNTTTRTRKRSQTNRQTKAQTSETD